MVLKIPIKPMLIVSIHESNKQIQLILIDQVENNNEELFLLKIYFVDQPIHLLKNKIFAISINYINIHLRQIQ
jgi:hypothetical protein